MNSLPKGMGRSYIRLVLGLFFKPKNQLLDTRTLVVVGIISNNLRNTKNEIPKVLCYLHSAICILLVVGENSNNNKFVYPYSLILNIRYIYFNIEVLHFHPEIY